MPKACIIGTQHLGGAVGHHLVSRQWDVTGLARSDASRKAAEQAGVAFLPCDASDPAALRATLEEARKAHGDPDLIVNAASAARPPPGGPPRRGAAGGAAPRALPGG